MKHIHIFLALILTLTLCLGGAALAEGQWTEELQAQSEAMSAEIARLEAERGLSYSRWTVQEKYDLDQQFIDYLRAIPNNTAFSALPGDGDLSEADALAAALAAVTEKYGDTAFDPALTREDVVALTAYDSGERIWSFDFFMTKEGGSVEKIYHVFIDSPTGEILDVNAGEEGHG